MKEKSRRFERHLQRQLEHCANHKNQRPALDHLEMGLNSWRGHVGFGQSSRLQHRVFWVVRASGINVLPHPNKSWRVL